MVKVLHVFNELKFSGAEIMYTAAASEFQKLGCKLYAVNTSPSLGEYAPFFEKEGYTILHWSHTKKLTDRVRFLKSVIRYLKKEKIDVVHIHRTDLKWEMSLCAKLAGCKAIYTFHNVFTSHWYSYAFHYLIRWSAKNFFGCIFQTISDSVYKNEKDYYYNKTIKIYNWYDNNRFFPAQSNERLRIRKELDIEEETLVIISVGGCSHIKRHSHVLRALHLILSQYPNSLYLHLGEGNTLHDEVELAKELDVEKRVRFIKNQLDVRKYLIASDIYVMTSEFEGISLTTIEALACQIPAVLYNVPGLRDFNSEIECTFLIDGNYNLLAKAIIDLYEDKQRQKEFINHGKQFVDSKYSMLTNARKIFALYK